MSSSKNKKSSFNIYFIIYAILAIAIIFGGTNKMYGENLMIQAIFFFIAASAIFLIYGLRWFGTDKSLLSNAPVSWPPTINTCPDYLTYYNLIVGKESYDMCIDMIGVSRKGGITQFPANNPPVDPLSPAYFSLATKSADPVQRNAELCQRAMMAGLTWEGITNGESCISLDGSASSSPPAAASGCPA
jgi:hypothetical protein